MAALVGGRRSEEPPGAGGRRTGPGRGDTLFPGVSPGRSCSGVLPGNQLLTAFLSEEGRNERLGPS